MPTFITADLKAQTMQKHSDNTTTCQVHWHFSNKAILKHIQATMTSRMSTQLQQMEQGAFTKQLLQFTLGAKLHPSLNKTTQRRLTQFLSGHFPHHHYLHRMKLRDDGDCCCGHHLQDGHHLLYHCPHLTHQRAAWRSSLEEFETTTDMLTQEQLPAYGQFVMEIYQHIQTCTPETSEAANNQ